MAERAKAMNEEMFRRLERHLNPTSEERRLKAEEYRRRAPEREAETRKQNAAVLMGGPELVVRWAIDQQASELYAARDFEQLDKIYDDYASQSARTASGVWKASVMFIGLRNLVDKKQQYDQNEALLKQWLRDRPGSALAHQLRAQLMLNRAWAIRGGGYAFSVKSENWALFHKKVREARQYLEKNKKVASRNPHYYALMLSIIKAEQGESDPWPTLEEGISKYPGYYEMYFAMLEYLLPTWHGDASQIEKFANMATERTGAIEGRSMYARIYWYASQTQYGDALFLGSFAQWSKMKTSFEDVVERYPDQWNLQNFANFACLAEDYKTLSALLLRVKEPVIWQAWKSRKHHEQCSRLAGRINL